MPDQTGSNHFLGQEAHAYYARGMEADRLARGSSKIEFARTQEIVSRYLPSPPAVIFDIGGAAGAYALWLARLGHEVHLVDPVPLHVEQARHASAQQPDAPIATCIVGDARHLERADASVDVALMFGPLYHLTERADRLAALREAARIVRPGGVVLAAAISRYSTLLDGLRNNLLADPAFVQIVRHGLLDGQHRNPTNSPGYFTTAYLHYPTELKDEIETAGLLYKQTLAIEGPVWLMADIVRDWDDPERRAVVLEALRWIEEEPSLLGAGGHLLAVAQKM